MLVTFGREATTELRERVRERLVSARSARLADPAAARAGADSGARAARRRARRRGRAAAARGSLHALAEFDAATIATTHQFCRQMLAGLGVAADADPDAVFVESVDDLVVEVVDDFYVRKYGDRAARARRAFDRAEALRAGPPAAVDDGQARLEPSAARARRRSRRARYRFAAAVRGRGRAAQAGAARLTPTTTCSPACDDALRRPRPEPRRSGCGRATGWCWSTSSRTPTRVQWVILRRAFHGPRPRWC